MHLFLRATSEVFLKYLSFARVLFYRVVTSFSFDILDGTIFTRTLTNLKASSIETNSDMSNQNNDEAKYKQKYSVNDLEVFRNRQAARSKSGNFDTTSYSTGKSSTMSASSTEAKTSKWKADSISPSKEVTSLPTVNPADLYRKKKPLRRKLPLPFMNVDKLGVAGRWEEIGGNFILVPENKNIKPVAVVHFLGGAFVGAAPHLSYRYLLESLADKGLIVVATPYRLDLDYLKICDGIVAKVDTANKYINALYGDLPIVGIGHSCGALLHSFLSSLFPDMFKDLNILISYNNRPASHAIPAFHELVVPLAKQIMTEKDKGVRETVSYIRRYIDLAIDLYADSGVSPTFVADEIVPLFRQGLEIVDQVPPLLQTIADGQEEFSPTPYHTKEVLRMMYRARRTLLVQFENDVLDETTDLESLLKEANTIMRMKINRAIDQMEVTKTTLDGTHVTPLTQNLLLDIKDTSLIQVPEEYNMLKTQFNKNFMRTINEMSNVISTYIFEHYLGEVPASLKEQFDRSEQSEELDTPQKQSTVADTNSYAGEIKSLSSTKPTSNPQKPELPSAVTPPEDNFSTKSKGKEKHSKEFINEKILEVRDNLKLIQGIPKESKSSPSSVSRSDFLFVSQHQS